MTDKKSYFKTEYISIKTLNKVAPLDCKVFIKENQEVDEATSQVIKEGKQERYPVIL